MNRKILIITHINTGDVGEGGGVGTQDDLGPLSLDDR